MKTELSYVYWVRRYFVLTTVQNVPFTVCAADYLIGLDDATGGEWNNVCLRRDHKVIPANYYQLVHRHWGSLDEMLEENYCTCTNPHCRRNELVYALVRERMELERHDNEKL